MKHEDRTVYRALGKRPGLVGFRVQVEQTDLWVQAAKDLTGTAREIVLAARGRLSGFIHAHPGFAEALAPWPLAGPAPSIVREMARAGVAAGTGPMAAVAGAVAQEVGLGLLPFSPEVIVENGGDIFLRLGGPVTIGIFAGASPLSGRVGIRLFGGPGPFAVCASSGTVGHSLSLGKADAAVVTAASCPLADAVATAMGNRVKGPDDIPNALDFGLSINGVDGVAVVCGDKIGAAGNIELAPLGGKKP